MKNMPGASVWVLIIIRNSDHICNSSKWLPIDGDAVNVANNSDAEDYLLQKIRIRNPSDDIDDARL